MLRIISLIFLIPVIFISCSSTGQLQRVNIQKEELNNNAAHLEKFEQEFQAYREGSAGGGGSKTSGGCGCN